MAAAMYIAEERMANTHGRYERWERSPVEMTTSPSGRMMTALLTWPRVTVERLLLDGRQVLTKRLSPEVRARALARLGYRYLFLGMSYQLIKWLAGGTEDDEDRSWFWDSLNPFVVGKQLISWRPLGAFDGEAMFEWVQNLFRFYGGEEQAWNPLVNGTAQLVKTQIAFGKYAENVLALLTKSSTREGATEQALRRVREMLSETYKAPKTKTMERNAMQIAQTFFTGRDTGLEAWELKRVAAEASRLEHLGRVFGSPSSDAKDRAAALEDYRALIARFERRGLRTDPDGLAILQDLARVERKADPEAMMKKELDKYGPSADEGLMMLRAAAQEKK